MIIEYRPIGVVHSPFHSVEGVPVQPSAAAGTRGTVEVYEEFVDGLKDLQGFSHIILLYHGHLAGEPRLQVVPFLDSELRGVFATRAPSRPNAIGLSAVRLRGVEDNVLQVENLDILDGTPLLDIKPYVRQFDHHEVERQGWLAGVAGDVVAKRSNGRFGRPEESAA